MVAEKVDYYLCVKCVEHAQCYSEMKCKEEEEEAERRWQSPQKLWTRSFCGIKISSRLPHRKIVIWNALWDITLNQQLPWKVNITWKFNSWKSNLPVVNIERIKKKNKNLIKRIQDIIRPLNLQPRNFWYLGTFKTFIEFQSQLEKKLKHKA